MATPRKKKKPTTDEIASVIKALVTRALSEQLDLVLLAIDEVRIKEIPTTAGSNIWNCAVIEVINHIKEEFDVSGAIIKLGTSSAQSHDTPAPSEKSLGK